MARELARLHLDAIFALSPVAIEAAKRATGTIPIVMLLTYSDPIELRFVASFAHPSGSSSSRADTGCRRSTTGASTPRPEA